LKDLDVRHILGRTAGVLDGSLEHHHVRWQVYLPAGHGQSAGLVAALLLRTAGGRIKISIQTIIKRARLTPMDRVAVEASKKRQRSRKRDSTAERSCGERFAWCTPTPRGSSSRS
jgi:hypothetical protein